MEVDTSVGGGEAIGDPAAPVKQEEVPVPEAKQEPAEVDAPAEVKQEENGDGGSPMVVDGENGVDGTGGVKKEEADGTADAEVAVKQEGEAADAAVKQEEELSPEEAARQEKLARMKEEVARRVQAVNEALESVLLEEDDAEAEQTAAERRRSRKRKRWADASEVPAAPTMGMGLPGFAPLGMGIGGHFMPMMQVASQPTEQDMKDQARVQHLTKMLMINDFTEELENRPRSPSPPPKYDRNGKRTNTRDVRYKAKFQKERDDLVKALLERDPTYKPPVHYSAKKIVHEKRIYLDPEYPGLKGAIIGVRGMQHRKLQEETNCKIRIQGRNSGQYGMKDFGREEVDDELHCLVSADNEMDLAKGIAAVEQVIDDALKGNTKDFQEQMLLLDRINGTLRPEMQDRYKQQLSLTSGPSGAGGGGGGGGAGGGGGGGGALGEHMPAAKRFKAAGMPPPPSFEQMQLAKAVPWAVQQTGQEFSPAFMKEQADFMAFTEQLNEAAQKESKLNDEYRSLMSSLEGEDPSKVLASAIKNEPTLEQEISDLGFIMCSNCKLPGHVARDCRNPKAVDQKPAVSLGPSAPTSTGSGGGGSGGPSAPSSSAGMATNVLRGMGGMPGQGGGMPQHRPPPQMPFHGRPGPPMGFPHRPPPMPFRPGMPGPPHGGPPMMHGMPPPFPMGPGGPHGPPGGFGPPPGGMPPGPGMRPPFMPPWQPPYPPQ